MKSIFRKRWLNLILISSSIVAFHILMGWIIYSPYVLDLLNMLTMPYMLIFPNLDDLMYSFKGSLMVDTMDDIIIPIFLMWLKVYIAVHIINFLFFRKRK